MSEDGRPSGRFQWWCGILLVILGPLLAAIEYARSAGISLIRLWNPLLMIGLGIFSIRQGASRMRSQK